MHVRVLCATRLFVRYMSLKARSSWSGAADPSRDSRITAAWSLSACGACTIHLAALRACREADFIGMGQHQIQPSSDCMELKIRQIRRWYMDVINWIKDGSFKELGLCNRLVPLKSYDKARNGKEVKERVEMMRWQQVPTKELGRVGLTGVAVHPNWNYYRRDCDRKVSIHVSIDVSLSVPECCLLRLLKVKPGRLS